VRFLIDANLPPVVVAGLIDAGYDALHVGELGLISATDEQIFDEAVNQSMAVVTADSDFPMLLALRRAVSPSVIHLRHVSALSPAQHVELLVENLPPLIGDLERGSVVSLSPRRMSVRALPLR
jgi:predicted nuclease of predicted toxin-antitoxin system